MKGLFKVPTAAVVQNAEGDARRTFDGVAVSQLMQSVYLSGEAVDELGLRRLEPLVQRTRAGVFDVVRCSPVRLCVSGRECTLDAYELATGSHLTIGHAALLELDLVPDEDAGRLVVTARAS